MLIQEFIDQYNVTLHSKLIEDTTPNNPNDKKQGYMKYDVTVNCRGRSATFEYTMGCAYVTYINKSQPNINKYQWHKSYTVPNICNVMISLQLDTASADESFDDFCWSFGYSNDSSKALGIYNACQENARKMRSLLGRLYNDFIDCTED